MRVHLKEKIKQAQGFSVVAEKVCWCVLPCTILALAYAFFIFHDIAPQSQCNSGKYCDWEILVWSPADE